MYTYMYAKYRQTCRYINIHTHLELLLLISRLNNSIKRPKLPYFCFISWFGQFLYECVYPVSIPTASLIQTLVFLPFKMGSQQVAQAVLEFVILLSQLLEWLGLKFCATMCPAFLGILLAYQEISLVMSGKYSYLHIILGQTQTRHFQK